MGNNALSFPAVTRELFKPGYEIGNHQNTVDATDALIDTIEARGFRIVSLIDALYMAM